MRRAELLNILFFILLVVIFFPQIKPFAYQITGHKFFVEAIAVALGVIGGFFANYVIESVKLKRSIIGALSSLHGEVLSNKESIILLIQGIKSIPCLSDPSHYSDKQALIQMAQAEKFLADHARETLNDKNYIELVNTLVEIEDTELLQRIIDSYLDLNRVRSALLMITVDHPIDIKDKHLIESRTSAEKSFNLDDQALKKLLETWEKLDREIMSEIKRLRKKILYRLF